MSDQRSKPGKLPSDGPAVQNIAENKHVKQAESDYRTMLQSILIVFHSARTLHETRAPEIKKLPDLVKSAAEPEKSLRTPIAAAVDSYIDTIMQKIDEMNNVQLKNKVGKLEEIRHAIRAAQYFIGIAQASDQFKKTKEKNEFVTALANIDTAFLTPLSLTMKQLAEYAQQKNLQAIVDEQFRLDPPRKAVDLEADPEDYISPLAPKALADDDPIPEQKAATTAQAVLREIDEVYQAAKGYLTTMHTRIYALPDSPEKEKALASHRKITSLVSSLSPTRLIANNLEEILEQLTATCTLAKAEFASIHAAAENNPEQHNITHPIYLIFSGQDSDFGKLRDNINKLAKRVESHSYAALIQLEEQAARHIQKEEILPAFRCYRRLCELTKQQPQNLLQQAILNWNISQLEAALNKLTASSGQDQDAQTLIPVVRTCLLLAQAKDHLKNHAFSDALACLKKVKNLLTTPQFTPSATNMLKEIISDWDEDQCKEALAQLAAIKLPQQNLTQERIAVIKQCLEERHQAAQAEETPAKAALARLRDPQQHHRDPADLNLTAIYAAQGIEAVQRKIDDFTHAECLQARHEVDVSNGLTRLKKNQIIGLVNQRIDIWMHHIEPELVKMWEMDKDEKAADRAKRQHFTMFACSQYTQQKLMVAVEKRHAKEDLKNNDVMAAYKCYQSIEEDTEGREKAHQLLEEAIKDWDAARCTAALAKLNSPAAKPDEKQRSEQVQAVIDEFARRYQKKDDYGNVLSDEAGDWIGSAIINWDVAHCEAALAKLPKTLPELPKDASGEQRWERYQNLHQPEHVAKGYVERRLEVARKEADKTDTEHLTVAFCLQQRLTKAKEAEQEAVVVAGPAAPGAVSSS